MTYVAKVGFTFGILDRTKTPIARPLESAEKTNITNVLKLNNVTVIKVSV